METPVRDLSDAQLAVAIGRFRDDALAEAYRRHGGAVFALARRVTGDSGDAEDVTQEVFLRLWNQPDRFDADRGSMRSFLLAQSHGKAVDLVRSRTARARREERDARALFVFIGAEPHTQWLEGTLVRDEKGFLITGANLLKEGKKPPNWKLQREPYLLETNIPGVFAVGDAREGAVRRVANSVGEGSIVLYFIRQHLANR